MKAGRADGFWRSHWLQEACLSKPVLDCSTAFLQRRLYGTPDTSRMEILLGYQLQYERSTAAPPGYYGRSPEVRRRL